ncbi:MAG: hypothetical protein ACFE85_18115 [Candidatus Hodarchaeota archaeon]
MIKIPRRKQKIKYSRKQACKFLSPMGDLSNSLQPLCYCPERDLILGRRAYVCQVCFLYTQINRNIPEIYEESRKLAEKKIKEKKIELEEFELEEVKGEEEIDLTIDEFEEEDEEVPVKFEKRKAGKEDMEGEDFTEVECPFCGELFDNLLTHIKTCEFAPDDASIEDVLPKRSKKKRKRRTTPTAKTTVKTEDKDGKEKQTCPYCGKEYQRLGRHISSCPKRPNDEEDID